MNYTIVMLRRGTPISFMLDDVSYSLAKDQVAQLIDWGVLIVTSYFAPFFCYNCRQTFQAATKPRACPHCQMEEWDKCILFHCGLCNVVFEQNWSENPYNVSPRCPRCGSAVEIISDFRHIILNLTGVDDPEVVKDLVPRLEQIRRNANHYDALERMIKLLKQAVVDINVRATEQAVQELTGAKKPKEDGDVSKEQSDQAFIELMRRRKEKQFGKGASPIKSREVDTHSGQLAGNRVDAGSHRLAENEEKKARAQRRLAELGKEDMLRQERIKKGRRQRKVTLVVFLVSLAVLIVSTGVLLIALQGRSPISQIFFPLDVGLVLENVIMAGVCISTYYKTKAIIAEVNLSRDANKREVRRLIEEIALYRAELERLDADASMRSERAIAESESREIKGIIPEADRAIRPKEYPSHWDNKGKRDDRDKPFLV